MSCTGACPGCHKPRRASPSVDQDRHSLVGYGLQFKIKTPFFRCIWGMIFHKNPPLPKFYTEVRSDNCGISIQTGFFLFSRKSVFLSGFPYFYFSSGTISPPFPMHLRRLQTQQNSPGPPWDNLIRIILRKARRFDGWTYAAWMCYEEHAPQDLLPWRTPASSLISWFCMLSKM